MYAVCHPLMKRRAMPALLVLLFAVLALGFAPAAWANTATLSSNDPSPAVGTPVTFTVAYISDCAPSGFHFSVDSVQQATQMTNELTTTFSTAGNHTVSVTVDFQSTGGPPGSCGTASDTNTVAVGPGVSGTIAVNPDPARPGEPAVLSVTPSGGLGSPYTGYRWTIDGVADPAGDDKRSYSRTFSAGSHTVRVTLSDDPDPSSGNPPHSGSATRTITVEAPTTPPTTTTTTPGAPSPPPAPSAPSCTQQIAFALSEFKTDGCFAKTGTSPDRWETTDQVRLNGVAFADSGQRFIITAPTPSELGGHVKTDNAAIQLDRFIPFSGNVDWSLPAGGQGDEGTLREVAVPSFARLFKLRVAGSIAIKLGYGSDGKHYAAFPMNVELPPAFTAGPSKFSGGVSGAASIRVDDGGIHYDGLKISVSDAWVGSLKVPSACFSYVPAGGQAVAPCDAPEIDGKPYVECATDVTTDRFDGSAVVELPTASSTKLAAFGGLAGGQISKLGGIVDGLGTTLPIVPGVFLNRIGVGLCLSPPPFKLRGDVGVTALGGKLDINGHVLYTDATDTTPWSVDVGGNVKFNGTQLGDATVGFNAWGDVSFDVNAAVDLGEVASIKGNVNGWIEPRNSSFTIAGSVQGCIDGLPCAQASALVSNVGIAGCLDLGTYTLDLPDEVREGPFGFGSIVIITHTKTLHLQAGVGYKYGGKVDLLGDSCDLSPYAATRSASTARAAAGAGGAGLSERIRSGVQAVTLRLHGTNGPPKIVVRGPGGTTITSPAAGPAVQKKGHHVLAENASDGTTSVLLIKPAAGTWTVTAAPGAASTPTRMDRSDFQAPSVLFGQVRKAGDRREVAVQYAVPAGASVRLVERGNGIGRTLVKSVRGTRCRGTRALPDGRTMRCARVTFTPSNGPGGVRQIQAVVSRDGMPLTRKTVATFRVPPETRPSRPGALRARRVGKDVVIGFPKSRGASRYTATAVLDDGRRLGFDLAASCRAVRIPSVAGDDAVRFKLAGVRYDLQTGAYRKVTLAKNHKSAGPRGALPKRICR
ncbi:MAG: hypothetical protein QOF26_948 [Baekduia sp.]|nr:hypothetical protein [Baekduia sp.]